MTPRIYTKKGDDGTTGLLYGGRVRKDSWRIELNGAVDEAQAAIGLARAETAPGSEANERLTPSGPRPLRADGGGGHRPGEPHQAHGGVDPGHRRRWWLRWRSGIDDLLARFEMPSDFTVPGENRVAAALDLARTIVRRAERIGVSGTAGCSGTDSGPEGSLVGVYLNRLSDLLWAMARWQEGPSTTRCRRADAPRRRPEPVPRWRVVKRPLCND